MKFHNAALLSLLLLSPLALAVPLAEAEPEPPMTEVDSVNGKRSSETENLSTAWAFKYWTTNNDCSGPYPVTVRGVGTTGCRSFNTQVVSAKLTMGTNCRLVLANKPACENPVPFTYQSCAHVEHPKAGTLDYRVVCG